MILAQTNLDIPAPTAVMITLAVVSVLGWLIRQQAGIKAYIRDTAGVKEVHAVQVNGGKLETSGPTRMATWEELNRVETALRDLSDEVERSSSALAQEGSRRAASIHGRVDKLSGLVERLDERTETTNATVAELNRKIDLLLQKK